MGAEESTTTDEALVGAAVAGDARAFEMLLDRHEARVFRVLSLMGVPLPDREDVAQEVFVRLFRHLPKYRRGQRFDSWLYKIAVNASHDYRSRRRRELPQPLFEPQPDRDAADEAPPDESVDLRRRLLASLERLTERERAVFVLVELEGLDTGRAARALGISRITVRRHHGRARERLARALKSGEKTGDD